MSTVKEIGTDEEWHAHLASLPKDTLLIISFYTPWAAPCAQMSTVLGALASEYAATEPATTSWVAVNAEELSDVSEKYDVTAVPYLVLQRGGTVLETVSGSSAVEVRDAVEAHVRSGPPTGSAVTGSAAPTNGSTRGMSGQTDRVVETRPDPAEAKAELHRRLGRLVKAAPVMLFMKGTPNEPQCGFSRTLVGILRDRSVKFGFFNILADDEVRQGLKEFADWPTFPQLWVEGDLVGGLDIVKEIIENDPDFLKQHSVMKTAGA